MRPDPKKRIDTNPKQAGLANPFAQLDLGPLPSGPTVPVAPASPAPAVPEKLWKMGRVVLRKETARRGGKTVLVVHDFATHLPLSVIEAVGKRVRQTLGCGGTLKERTLEIQLDQPARLRAALEAEGFEVAGVR